MIEDRVAIVTGGASGIGRAVAERLTADGCRVAVVDLNAAQASAVADAIGGLAIQADLSQRADCRRAVRRPSPTLAGPTFSSTTRAFSTSRPSPTSRKMCGKSCWL